MKRLLLVFLSVCLLLSPAVLITGCKTTPDVTAVNISDAAKVTVESALGAWDAYIVQYHPTLEQQYRVRDMYRKYKAAQLVLLDAAIAYKETSTAENQQKVNVAIAAAGAALSDLVSLIRTFGAKI